jgi:hypothetical protein
VATRILAGVLYVTLLAVVVSTAQSIWVGITDPARYQQAFPLAQGALYGLSQFTSGAAGLNAVLIAFRTRWAIWLNPVIGLSSIVLLASVGSPRTNQIVVAIACMVSTLLPVHLGWARAIRR